MMLSSHKVQRVGTCTTTRSRISCRAGSGVAARMNSSLNCNASTTPVTSSGSGDNRRKKRAEQLGPGAHKPRLKSEIRLPEAEFQSLFWARLYHLRKTGTKYVEVTVVEARPDGLAVTCGPLEGFIPWNADSADVLERGGGSPGGPPVAEFLQRLMEGRLRYTTRIKHIYVDPTDQARNTVTFRGLHPAAPCVDSSLDCGGGEASPVVGQVRSGVVCSVLPRGSGAVVDLDEGGGTGRLRRSQISEAHVSSVGDVLAVGQRLKVFVTSVEKAWAPGRSFERMHMGLDVQLSTRKLELQPGDMLCDPRLVYHLAEVMGDRVRPAFLEAKAQERVVQKAKEDLQATAGVKGVRALLLKRRKRAAFEDLKVGQLVPGIVRSVEAYGVILDLGSGLTGLLHVGQISSARVKSLHDLLPVGTLVKAVVRNVASSHHRVWLSTRTLERRPGDMLYSPQSVFEQAEEMLEEHASLTTTAR